MSALRLAAVALLALAAASAAAAAGAAGAAGAAPDKAVVFERDLLYDMAATHGVDVLFVRDSAYRDVEVRVTVPDGASCRGLDGRVVVQPTAPPPLPSAVLVAEFTCSGQHAATVLGAPGFTVYQGKDRPLALDFTGFGQGVARVTVLGTPWS